MNDVDVVSDSHTALILPVLVSGDISTARVQINARYSVRYRLDGIYHMWSKDLMSY